MYAGFGAADVRTLKLPRCYSKEFDECWLADEPNDYPGCADFHAAFEANEDATDALVEGIPYCSEKERWYYAGGGVLAGIFIGSLLATVLS